MRDSETRLQSGGEMGWSFKDWKNAVDCELRRVYAIDIMDVGFEDSDLLNRYRQGFAPGEFVVWFGEKFDLTEVTSHAYR